jgi:2-hydroxycyclohexanecarboxyl-CoA dehydrogenase
MTMPDADADVGALSMWAADVNRQWQTPEMRARIAKAYPLRRVARPDDITGAVLFLASSAAGFITGQTLSVSGGYTMI